MPALRDAPAVLAGGGVAVDDRDLPIELGEHCGGEETGEAGAEDDCGFDVFVWHETNARRFLVPRNRSSGVHLVSVDLAFPHPVQGELASFLGNLDKTVAAGAFARVSDDLSRLLGRPTTRLVDGLRAP